jgi:glyoxylase-like metal-dependent hydrolase (beta-lactamase superfamily II)
VNQVVPGLYRLPSWLGPIPWTTAYLIDDGDLILVDTGMPKKERRILQAISRIGRRPFDVRHILITHHHMDHTGGLAALSQQTEARIHVHPLDAAVTRGDVPMPGPTSTSFGAKMMGAIASRLYPEKLPHVNIGHELADGERLDLGSGFRVFHTPGHTPGHVSILWEKHGGVLLVGDAAANMGRLGPPISAFTEDQEAMKRSVAKLAGLEFEFAVFGHGSPIKRGAAEKFRRLADRLS